MNVTYLEHSGFFVETKEAYFLFDYWKGDVPSRKEKEKPFYVLVSHAHGDHFNPDVFQLADERTTYILSYDTERKIRLRHLLDYAPAKVEQIVFIRYDECYENKGIFVNTLKSNDRGVAFVVESAGERFYHAGDLNLWMKESADKATNNNIKALFERELEKIKGKRFQAAFLPLDHTIGNYATAGIHRFLECCQVENLYPMHMWEHLEYIDILVEEGLPEGVCLHPPVHKI